MYGYANPAYAGSIVSLLAVCLVYGSIFAFVSELEVCYGVRIGVEEKTLQEQFAKEFKDYCYKTKYRLFPHMY